jgi:PAS domain S-box-containing protein
MNANNRESAHSDEKKDAGAPRIRRGAQSRVPLRAGIIGGGKACDDLLTLLSDERLNRLNMEILGVADLDLEAPGIVHAKAMSIFTTRDFTDLFSLPGLNLLIELTGSMQVRKRMIRSKPIQISSIDHRGARLLWDMMQIEAEKLELQSQAEKAIRKERDWCQKVIDSLPDRIMVLNRDYTIHGVNKTFVRETGLREDDVLGRFCYSVSHGIDELCSRKGQRCPLEEVLSTRRTCSVIHVHQGVDQESVYEEIVVTPIFSNEGKIDQVIEAIRDVTRRITLERELRESEQKLRQFLESAHDIICIKDLEGRYLYVNPAAAESIGMPSKGVIGRTDSEIFTDKVAQHMAARDQEVLVQRRTLVSKEKMHVYDRVRHFHTVRFPIVNDQGEMIAFSIVSRDMTDEVTLQEQVEQSKEYLENIVSNSSDMIVTTDLQGRIVTFNPGAERMLGYSHDEVIGVDVEKFWNSPEERRRLMQEVNAAGAVNNYPATLIDKGGHEVEISLSLAQLKDSSGQVLGTVGISKDVTEENRLRRQLIEQERLAAVGQTVAGVTHCMKNVLNGLKGGAYMVNVGLKRRESELLEEGWENVQKGIERISRLSMDMLSYCRERKPAPVPTDPLQLVRETTDILLKSAVQEGIEIITLGEEGPPADLDPEAIGRALLNLITNAVDACREKSYSSGENPQVTVSVKRPKGEILFLVRDNGSGMVEEVRKNLFTRFFTTKETGGTGLGLCVTQKIVEEHGGRITVDSAPGAGTTFTIALSAIGLQTRDAPS